MNEYQAWRTYIHTRRTFLMVRTHSEVLEQSKVLSAKGSLVYDFATELEEHEVLPQQCSPIQVPIFQNPVLIKLFCQMNANSAESDCFQSTSIMC